MLTMRQKDLSSVYMQIPGRICVVVKCISCRTQCVQIRVKLKSDYTTGNISDIDHNVNHEAE